MSIWNDLQHDLNDRRAAGLFRHPATLDSPVGPRVRLDGKDVLCLCSNDYLSLANHPAVRAAAVEAIGQWGVGAGASRLVSGTTQLHRALEERLAAFKGVEAVTVTSTGWMANHAAIHTLVGSGDLILCDKLNHASILDASASSGARLRTYRHGDVERLGALLARHRAEHRRCLIATDSVFSMDGDLAPLAAIVDLKKRYDAILLIDEAHATGVLGQRGRGAAELFDVEDGIDVTVGTLSKALGGLGGFVAGPAVLRDAIVNAGREFIYTTSLPPALCASAMAALDIVETKPQRRQRVLSLAKNIRNRLSEMGFDTMKSETPIIPIPLGDAGRAVEVSRRLLEAGYLVPAIRPPTVPRGTSRLRVSLCADHTPDDLAGFCDALTVAAGHRPQRA